MKIKETTNIYILKELDLYKYYYLRIHLNVNEHD